MTMFEKIAEALLIHKDANVYEQTRAVLAVMHEPTQEMVNAGMALYDRPDWRDMTLAHCYRSMIDAAAAEPGYGQTTEGPDLSQVERA